MSRRAQQYAELGAVGSPQMEKKPTLFKCFLLNLSKHFSQETVENLKIFVAHNDQFTDPGFLTSSKIEQSTTAFGLLMNLVEANFMKPHDMSKLIDFLEASGEMAIVQKVKAFQAETTGSAQSRSSTMERIQDISTTAEHPSDDQSTLQHQPADEDHQHPIASASTTPLARISKSHNLSSQEELESEQQLRRPHQQCTDSIRLVQGTTANELLPYSFNVSKQQWLLGKMKVHIPPHLKDALAAAVIGHYTEIFRSADKHFGGAPELRCRLSNSVWFDFEHGSIHLLSLFPWSHPASFASADYECIVQLIMEGILLAPNAMRNLSALLKSQLHIPESLRLLYMSRLPSVESDEALWKKLTRECEELIEKLQLQRKELDKAHKYLAQVYDAMGYLIKHKKDVDFTERWTKKAEYHHRASQERKSYQCCSDFEVVLVLLEQTRSIQSQGYAHSEVATNSDKCIAERIMHSHSAHELHKFAINEHARPLLRLLDMDKEMSEPVALTANLRFDEMLRDLRPDQLGLLQRKELSEDHKHEKCIAMSKKIESEAGRIQDLLSWRTVPAHAILCDKMRKCVATLLQQILKGAIQGFALNDPTISE